MSETLTEEELKEMSAKIEKAEKLRADPHAGIEADDICMEIALQDAPTLLSEIRRLRGVLRRMDRQVVRLLEHNKLDYQIIAGIATEIDSNCGGNDE